MKKTAFPTPQDAEQAFYDALEKRDLEAMMDVWADDEEIVCVHPGRERLAGYEQVRAMWSDIFRSDQRLKVEITRELTMQGMMLAVHSVHEKIRIHGEQSLVQVVSTNIYSRTPGGWRMIVHHASAVPQLAAPIAPEPPKILH